MNIEKSIYATKNVFEESFEKGDFYNKQTQDEQHLKAILEFLPIRSGMRILDLGTGSGYLSFAIAQRYSNVSVFSKDTDEHLGGQSCVEEGWSHQILYTDGMDGYMRS